MSLSHNKQRNKCLISHFTCFSGSAAHGKLVLHLDFFFRRKKSHWNEIFFMFLQTLKEWHYYFRICFNTKTADTDIQNHRLMWCLISTHTRFNNTGNVKSPAHIESWWSSKVNWKCQTNKYKNFLIIKKWLFQKSKKENVKIVP